MHFFFTDDWDGYLSKFHPKQKDIYFKKSYVSLYETSPDEKALAMVIEEGEKVMLFPILSRTFLFHGVVYKDFETAYGYGGPIFNTDDIDFIGRANKLMLEAFLEEKYVCGFVRFHPLLNNSSNFKVGTVIDDRHTVAIDLTLSEEDIWMKEIHTKNRNVIKKGEKNGLKFFADYDHKYLDEFIRLYDQTMDKLNADDFYYFDKVYYQKFIKDIPNFLGVVMLDDKVVSAALFMYDGCYAHYHLSGSDREFLNYLPNNYMLYHAALELKGKGAELFHLGGGTTSDENDSLLSFKRKFSKELFQFSIGKVIFNNKIYAELCTDWEERNPEKKEKYSRFLLKYKY